MPDLPLKICAHGGCNELTRNRLCPAHAYRAEAERREQRRQQDLKRGSANKRGYTYQWQKARTAFLKLHQFCGHCLRENKHVKATVVDHIIPHRGDMVLFWDRTNWQPLCKRHHDIKTASEDGGFGNRK